MVFCALTPVSVIRPWRVTLVCVCVFWLLYCSMTAYTVLHIYTESFKYGTKIKISAIGLGPYTLFLHAVRISRALQPNCATAASILLLSMGVIRSQYCCFSLYAMFRRKPQPSYRTYVVSSIVLRPQYDSLNSVSILYKRVGRNRL